MTLIEPGVDRWAALHRIEGTGVWTWYVRAWSDDWASWLHDAEIKVPAGIDVELMLEAGARLLERATGEDGRSEDARRTFTDAAGSPPRPRDRADGPPRARHVRERRPR